MALFGTYSEFKSFPQSEAKVASVLERARGREGKRIFLSHSSKDNDLVPGALVLLESNGGSVYVDMRDDGMPEKVSHETASRLRSAIVGCPKFVLLATPRSSTSKWIPWELGVGDGNHSDRNVALLPSAETAYEQDWSEQEYLGLYQRIVWGHFGEDPPQWQWLVLNHIENTAIKLRDWIARS